MKSGHKLISVSLELKLLTVYYKILFEYYMHWERLTMQTLVWNAHYIYSKQFKTTNY